MPKKFYAVKNGKKIGIYTTWEECKEQVNGYKGAEYKGFEKREDALLYLSGNVSISHTPFPNKNEVFVYVDGSFNVKTFEYGYGIVIIFSDEKIITLSGKDNKQEIATMRNVAGELKGTMVATNYILQNFNEIKKMTIFHDYEGISKWVNGQWKTNLEHTTKYKEYMTKMKNKIEIDFIKVAAHTGDKYNEMADELAKKELGIEK